MSLIKLQVEMITVVEEMMQLKFEKIHELKMTYDFMLKKLNKEKHDQKIQEIQKKKDENIERAKKEMDDERI